MVNIHTTGMDADLFDYELFSEDLNRFCEEKQTSIQAISEDILTRDKNWLNSALRSEKLPIAVASVVCRHIGKKLSDYQIERQETLFSQPPKQENNTSSAKPDLPLSAKSSTQDVPVPSAPKIQVEPGPQGWKVSLIVNSELLVVSSIISNDGKVLGTGSSTMRGKENADVIEGIRESISVACDNAMMQMYPPKSRTTADEVIDLSAGKVSGKPFKDWVMRFYSDHSDVGRLARFIDGHYGEFPSWGGEKMRRYLKMTKGGAAHVNTFNAFFERYRAEDRAEERANNAKSRYAVSGRRF